MSVPSTARCVSQVLQVNSLIQTQKSSELAAALLSVYLERAEDLPVRASPVGSWPGWSWGEIIRSYDGRGCHVKMEMWLCGFNV